MTNNDKIKAVADSLRAYVKYPNTGNHSEDKAQFEAYLIYAAKHAIEAYESARTPRTITREELQKSAIEFCNTENNNPRATTSDCLQEALAALGITVEG